VFSKEFVQEMIAIAGGDVHASDPVQEISSLFSAHVQILTNVSAETVIRIEAAVAGSSIANPPSIDFRRKSLGILKELFERMECEKQALKTQKSSTSDTT
jgi:hypothetical protein